MKKITEEMERRRELLQKIGDAIAETAIEIIWKSNSSFSSDDLAESSAFVEKIDPKKGTVEVNILIGPERLCNFQKIVYSLKGNKDGEHITCHADEKSINTYEMLHWH